MLRPLAGGALALAGCVVCLEGAPLQHRASDILADARRALAGSNQVVAVRSFVIQGTLDRGYTLHSRDYGSFEWLAELPARFVVVNAFTTASAGDTGSVAPYIVGLPTGGSVGASVSRSRTRLGFNGEQVIYGPDLGQAGSLGRERFFADPPTQADLQPYLAAARQVFAEITLGLFAQSFPGAPVELVDLPAPGRAIEVRGLREVATMTFDPVTHLPVTFGTLRYGDYRTVEGRQVPFRFEYEGRAWGAGRIATLVARVRDVRFNLPMDEATFRPWPPAR